MLLLRTQLTELKLVNLKSQVNPRFQFNCLSSVYTALMTGETARWHRNMFPVLPACSGKVLILADKDFYSYRKS